MRRCLLALVLLASTAQAARSRAPAAPARPTVAPAKETAPAPTRASVPAPVLGPGDGVVTYVSAQRAYVSLGRADGIDAGQELAFVRAGKPAGKCRIEQLSEHHASCIGTGLAKGDRFHVDPPLPAPPAPEAPKGRPGQRAPTAAEMAATAKLLASAPYELVAYRGEERERLVPRGAEAALTHTTWGAQGIDAYHQERLDVALRGFELIDGVRLSLAATAFTWAGRPVQARYRPETNSALFVREFELSAREPGTSYAVSLGRLWPWHLPGLAVLDGAQAGWKSASGTEIGAYGGGLPDAVSLAPAFARWTAGGYWALSRASSDGFVRYLRHEGRAGVLVTPEGGQRLEAQALVQATLSTVLDASAEVRGGIAGGETALDVARVDVLARPGDHVRIGGDFRYFGASAARFETVAVGAEASRRGAVSASWDPSPDVALGLAAGLAEELSSGLGRKWVGPELGFPRLFGARGSLSTGYLEEFGHQAGRSAYAQALLLAAERVQLLARLSYFEDALSADLVNRDAALFASVDTALQSWLALRISVFARGGIDALVAGDPEGSYSVSASLRAGAF